jgi:hypothetical protein
MSPYIAPQKSIKNRRGISSHAVMNILNLYILQHIRKGGGPPQSGLYNLTDIGFERYKVIKEKLVMNKETNPNQKAVAEVLTVVSSDNLAKVLNCNTYYRLVDHCKRKKISMEEFVNEVVGAALEEADADLKFQRKHAMAKLSDLDKEVLGLIDD